MIICQQSAVKFIEMSAETNTPSKSSFSLTLKIQKCERGPKAPRTDQITDPQRTLPTAGSIWETKARKWPLSTKFRVSSLSSTYYSDRTCSSEIQRVHVRHMQITLSESCSGFGNSVSLGCFNYRLWGRAMEGSGSSTPRVKSLSLQPNGKRANISLVSV